MNIIELQKEYNYWLARYYKAEQYFRENNENNCNKYLELFNQIVEKLSVKKREIEKELNRELTEEEIFHGFNI